MLRRPLPVPRPLPAAVLNLVLEAAAVVTGWTTRVDYGALILALVCLPLSMIVLFSIVRELEVHPHAVRRRRAAVLAAILWLPTLVLGLAMAFVLTGRTPFSLFRR